MNDRRGYPERPAFFAHRFCRLMVRTCLANDLGTDVVTLLMTVALTEDAKRYRGAVTFYNAQLMPLIGVRSEHSLIRTRERAVEAGWLHYEPANRLAPGRYWVTIPAGLDDLPDSSVDENSTEYTAPGMGDGSGAKNAPIATGQTPSTAKNAPEETGETTGQTTVIVHPFLPSPSPSPLPCSPVADGQPAKTKADKPKKPSGEKKPRQPNPLFDAVAEVTGSSVARHASHIGTVVSALKAESPPFTPDGVRAFGTRFHELVPEAKTWTTPQERPTLGTLQKHIGRVRDAPAKPAQRYATADELRKQGMI